MQEHKNRVIPHEVLHLGVDASTAWRKQHPVSAGRPIYAGEVQAIVLAVLPAILEQEVKRLEKMNVEAVSPVHDRYFEGLEERIDMDREYFQIDAPVALGTCLQKKRPHPKIAALCLEWKPLSEEPEPEGPGYCDNHPPNHFKNKNCINWRAGYAR